MRRAVWVAVISMGVILLLAVYADGARRNIGHELMRMRRQMLEEVAAEDWEGTRKTVLEADRWWHGKEEMLALFTHHELTDAVGDGITQILISLETENAYELYEGLEMLKNAAERLHEQDAFVLKNIL